MYTYIATALLNMHGASTDLNVLVENVLRRAPEPNFAILLFTIAILVSQLVATRKFLISSFS